MVIAVLILLGLAFGSFINAYVWRLHEQSLPAKKRKMGKKDISIAHGRSMCVHCGHTLQAADLVPVLSWIWLQGKCRYCKIPISPQYPLVELTTVLLFIVSYLAWPIEFDAHGTVSFVVWLVSLVGLMALVVYDLRWMLLPNKIIFPLGIFVALSVIIDSIFISQSIGMLVSAILAVLVGGGIFYILFQVSDGRWIGGGDVKLGFLLGLLVGEPLLAFLMLFIASLGGSLLMIPLVVSKKMSPKTRIPFGPFLIIAAIITRLYGQSIIDAYTRAIGL